MPILGVLAAFALSLTGLPGRVVRVHAFSDLLTACRTARPGDEILLAPGIYRIIGRTRIAIENRPGPVTVRGETSSPADVIVEGAGQDDPSVQMAFDLDDSPRWTFENLTVRNTYYHGFKFNSGSTDCVLRNVVMRDHGESGVKGTSNPTLGRYRDRLLVDHCDIGFSTDRGGTRSVVEGIDGVGVKGWIVRNCRFLNVRHPGSVAYAVFTKGNSIDTLIDSNRFENCDIGASFGGGGTGPKFFRDNDRTYEHRRGEIRNNVFVRCRDAGVYINKGTDCRVDNNTLFECVLSIQLRYPQSSGRARNNLILPSLANPSEPAVRLRDCATAVENRANLLAVPGDFRIASGPDSEIDVRLAAGSRARGAGLPIPNDVPVDANGEPRPKSGPWDVGAYQSGG